MNTIIKLSLTVLFLTSVFTSKAVIDLTLTPANGTCVSDCKITAFAQNTTGSVTYAIITSSVGYTTPPQSSGLFEGLEPGTYTVGVYDNTTGGVPKTETVTVKTSYKPIVAKPPVASYDPHNYCSNSGTLKFSFDEGKEPFRIKITNTTTGVWEEVSDITSHSYIFNSLAAGDYGFEVMDACGQGIHNASGEYINIPQVENLSGMTFSSIAFANDAEGNSYVEFEENDNCTDMSIKLYSPCLKVYLNGTTNTLNLGIYKQVKFRIEYPAGSEKYSSWQDRFTSDWFTFDFTNFNRSQPNGDKFRVEVKHPCTGDTIISQVYNIIEPTFQYHRSASTTDYCKQDLLIDIHYFVTTPDLYVKYVDGCGPYTVVLKNSSGAAVSTLITPASGTENTGVRFSDVPVGTYSATITGPNGFSQTIPSISVIAQNLEPTFRSFDESPIYGYNFIFCDYTTTAITASISNYISSIPVTYSITAASGTPTITRPDTTITYTSSDNYLLWTDIPWGTYNITANMDCKTVTQEVPLTQPVTGFETNLSVANNVVCGLNDLVADAHYVNNNGGRVTSGNLIYMYYMLIVDGPALIGTRAFGNSSGGDHKARIKNLPEGTYKVLFYPYYMIPTSTQIVDGKTVDNYPTTMYECYPTVTITIPDYVRPVIDIPMSGGITCLTGTTNLTVNVKAESSSPPFLYRYKVKGASDATYTPADFQTSNVFPNLPNGDYTVQVKDDCGSITTQDVRIFDGAEQFVGIIGEVLPGVVCETRKVILSVLSIGPVQSYKWEYRPNVSSPWTELPSTTGTYVIPSANQSHKGQYMVTIYNGQCYLSSDITIIDVLPPPGTPSITSENNVICLGGSTTLTANTTISSPNYQWYKDGSPVGTNSNTYSATAAGSYTVVVTPSLGCPSDPSPAYVVTEQIPAHPDASDLSADEICNWGHPVIHVANSLAGVTYNVYTELSGGVNVGSAVGTGSTIDITLFPTPPINATYYVGATLNSCNSSSRTAITANITSIPAAPTVDAVQPMCAGTMFSINVPSPDANYYYKVYTESTGGSPIGQSAKGSGTISGLTAPANATTYYVTAALSAGCESNRTSVSIPANPFATAANITAKDTAVCYGTTATLKVSSSLPSPTFLWYESQTATTPFHTGATYTTSALTADTVIYVSVLITGYCENAADARKAITVTVDSVCAKDDYIPASCDAMPVTIDVLVNDIKSPDCTPVVTIVSKPAHVTADVVSNKIVYTGTQSGIDTITYRVTCGSHTDEAKVYVTIDGSAFVDDVWYFGKNLAGESSTYKSAGIRFVKDGLGNYVPQDASGQSNIYSWENSLVVSSPYCNGQTIFYSSHDRLYNSLHEPLKNGTFSGHTSVADGLAACYMGDNKYLFFTVTDVYDNKKELRAYVVDMNGDSGKGERVAIPNEQIEPSSSNMAESIELIARAGTTSQYWLIYAHRNGTETTDNHSNELRVRLVDVSNPNSPTIGTIHSNISKTDSRTYSMASSQQHDRIAVTNIDNGSIDIFDFDNAAGTLSLRYNIAGLPAYIYGVEFSPDGKQLYASKHDLSNAALYQYDISGATPVQITGSPLPYWSQTLHDHKGGGLKLGPDGRIYVTQSYTDKVGVISDPNATTDLASRYNGDGLTLGVTYDGLQFSTGMTKPSVMSCNMNTPPTTQPDEIAKFCFSSTSRTLKVNVVANDTDAENNTVYLTSATFVNPSDAALADITVNTSDSTVSLTVKSGATVEAGYMFEIIYDVKDNGLPASQCAMDTLKVTAYPTPSYPDLRLRVCPDAGTFNLAKYIDTTDIVTNIHWTSQIPSIPIISPAGTISTNNLTSARVHTFTYAITSRCVIDQKRKVYLEVIKNDNVHLPKDTVVVCYKYAEAMQINQLLGIEAQGQWLYHAIKLDDTEENIDAYVTKSTAPSPYAGAIVMDGKAIYEGGSISSNSYHGLDNVKIVKFTYTVNSGGNCLQGKTYSVVIVLTEDIMK